MGISTIAEKVLESFQRPARVALLFSGKSGLAKTILKERRRYPNLHFTTLATDQAESDGKALAREFGLSFISVTGFVNDQQKRDDYFQRLFAALRAHEIDVVVYAGFRKAPPRFFFEIFPGISIHPSDLRLKMGGKVRYGALSAVADAIRAGENYLASTVHVVSSESEPGEPLLVSTYLPLEPFRKLTLSAIHEKLRKNCELEAFPRTLELLSRGELKEGQPLCLQDAAAYHSEARQALLKLRNEVAAAERAFSEGALLQMEEELKECFDAFCRLLKMEKGHEISARSSDNR